MKKKEKGQIFRGILFPQLKSYYIVLFLYKLIHESLNLFYKHYTS